MSVGAAAPPRGPRPRPPGRGGQGRGPRARRRRPRAGRAASRAADRGGRPQGRAQRGQQADRRGDPRRRRPAGPEVAALSAASTAAGARIEALDAELAAAEAGLEEAPSHPEPGRPRKSRSAARTPTSSSEPGAVRVPHDGDVGAGPGGTAPGRAGPTGRWARRSACSTSPRGAKITGSGFPVYRAPGAALQRALIDFLLGSTRGSTASPRSGRRPW